MKAEINFQIGNQELINFMVEQQIQGLREQLSGLVERISTLRDERTALTDELQDKAIESANSWIKNSAIPFFESIGVGKRAIKAFRSGTELSCTVGSHGAKLYVTVHVEYAGDDDDASDLAEAIYRMLNVAKSFKIDRAAGARFVRLSNEIQDVSLQIRGIEKQIANRDDVERSALAQMTRKALSDNPQLMDQLRGIAASITGNARLLESK